MIVNKTLLQGSEEWFRMRKGRPTASRFSDIITPKTGKLSAKSVGYMQELIGECFCPTYEGFFGNDATEHGNEFEPIARSDFEERTGLSVEQVGFVSRDDGIIGCSPDGLIKGASGEWEEGIEIKCPYAPKTQVAYLLDGELPDAHKPQVHGALAITGLPRWHFYSYHPNLAPLHLVIERDDFTDKVSEALDLFLIQYGEMREKAMKLCTPTITTEKNNG